ncbi:MAG: hypothetical protein SFY92_00050 [Verrucomicrobiae bacterium]|nr:hypothetical protein [Verrucomicrobiae bacterium]
MNPSDTHYRSEIGEPRKLHKGLDAVAYRLAGFYHRRGAVLEGLRRDAMETHRQALGLRDLSEETLRTRLAEHRDHFVRTLKPLREARLAALAAVAVAAERAVGLFPHPEQMMGALALDGGLLAEMATGEGKTLTVGIGVILSAWTGRPCHIMTANDYLAQRDALWLEPFFARCGVTGGYITGEMKEPDRRENYRRSLTYATGKDLVADFLRDRILLGSLQQATRRLVRSMAQPDFDIDSRLVMRGLHTAIVDEADSVLIDEAATPVIISQKYPNEPLERACRAALDISRALLRGEDYEADDKFREVFLTEAGQHKIGAQCALMPEIWRSAARQSELVTQALCAREFFLRDKQYVIQEDKIVIVDEFTGRLMPERNWQQGLHQAVEAKENLPISPPGETLASMSLQRFCRLFKKISGLTGTAWEAAPEFWFVYGLATVRIPTHRPCLRHQLPDRVFARQQDKWTAVVAEIGRLHALGRPLLVGTRSVETSELLARLLDRQGLPCRLLNAIHHKQEAQIISQAGQPGQITIATNMAGRGTDIKLGAGVADTGGLHVLATERHESGRIDRQLFGRAGRQGDPGSAQAFLSLEDELVMKFVPQPLLRSLAARQPAPDRNGGRVLDTLTRAAFTHAQHQAQRQAHRQREMIVQMDTWLDDALSFSSDRP